MKNLRLTVLAALLALSASQAAFAQAPGMRPPGMPAGAPGMPGGAPGMQGAAGSAAANAPVADSGAVSNSAVTTTTTTTSGISPDAIIIPDELTVDGVAVDANLTNTGGEPILMTLAGLALAASAFAFRRKVSA